MISSLRGTVLAAGGNAVIIDVGGVGIRVNVTPAFALAVRVGDEASAHTSLIVREDALTLYGFSTIAELDLFELLIGVTGVGPKSALGVLSAMSPEHVARAVSDEDDAAFRKVSGIGPKTAKLIIVSLTGRLVVATPVDDAPVTVASDVSDQVLAALTGLGWSEKVAASALEETLADVEERDRASVPVLLRRVLAALGPAQHSGRAS